MCNKSATVVEYIDLGVSKDGVPLECARCADSSS
jgi:hypothetical protein